jgi:hypothetical protein
VNQARSRKSFAFLRFVLAILGLTAGCANAEFHLWKLGELFSNADGSVQFVELSVAFNGEGILNGQTLKAMSGGTTRSFTFPTNLPFNTAQHRMLIATEGFKALGLVTPDYVVPNGFFGVAGGTVDFAGVDAWSYGALPVDGRLSLYRTSGTTAPATPTNFAGETAAVDLSAVTFNVQALWWRSPAGSENGWGVNLTHQGDIVFATWFTYDVDGSGLWLSSDARKNGPNSYAGQLYLSRGSPFNSTPYNSALFVPTAVGTASFSFTDASNGTFTYTLNGVTQSKPITKFVYSSPVPTCTLGGTAGATPNYQDLWWRSPAQSENGWGVNITHQGDILFVTWFTYGADGTDLWMTMDNAMRTAPATYSGAIYSTRGSAYNSTPYDASKFAPTQVGTGTLSFTDANNGTFNYTVNGVTQTKAITRYVFANPVSVCR